MLYLGRQTVTPTCFRIQTGGKVPRNWILQTVVARERGDEGMFEGGLNPSCPACFSARSGVLKRVIDWQETREGARCVAVTPSQEVRLLSPGDGF